MYFSEWYNHYDNIYHLHMENKSSEKILLLLRTEPELAAREIAQRIGVSPRAVEKQIAKLR